MDDKALADKLVAAGVLEQLDRTRWADLYHPIDYSDEPLDAAAAVRDWRVAGACLEQWPTTINVEHLQLTLDKMLRQPSAICEAFVFATDHDEQSQ